MPPTNVALQKKLLDTVDVDLSTRAFLSKIDRFNIDIPWSPHLYYYSVRGAENFHIYLWILKDLGLYFHVLPGQDVKIFINRLDARLDDFYISIRLRSTGLVFSAIISCSSQTQL